MARNRLHHQILLLAMIEERASKFFFRISERKINFFDKREGKEFFSSG